MFASKYWPIWATVVAFLVLGAFLARVSYIGVEAVQENTRTLARMGELAIGNKDMLAAVRKDMQLAAERFKVVDQQLTIIELQLDAARKQR